MPFTFKLSQRLARMRRAALLLSTAALAACELPVSTDESGTTAVSRVVISPKILRLQPYQTADFVAVTLTNGGDTATAPVSWSVTSGSITDTSTSSGSGRHVGRFKAGSDTGKVKVIAKGQPGGSDTAIVTIAPAAVASVTVSPTSAALQAGQTQQFTATTRDSAGNVLTGRTITWASSNTALLTVTATGLATAVAAGTATLSAVSEGRVGTASVTVTAPPAPPPPSPAPPGTVADLAVAGVTDSSVTLSFTEVSDGNGQPAGYEVRSAVVPISWGSATSVSRGTCATPLAGNAIGTRRTCTVIGLSSSTAYAFQMIAFRGTLNVDAVFGALSNVASGTTAAGAPKPVAAVTINPSSGSATVGGTQQFVATLKDASGNVLTGRAVTWSSSAPLVATVSGSGLATALVAGTTTINAISEGQTGTATLTVTALPPPPPVGSWQNEPAGFTTLTDNPFSALTGGGWDVIWNTNGYVTIGVDASAPASPASVLQVMYPQGFQGGSAPGTEIYAHASAKEVFAGFWWKPSNPWQNHTSNVNKLAFWFTGAGSDNVHLRMYGPGPYTIQFVQEFSIGSFPRQPNVTATPVTLGQWHRIEWYIKYATTSTSGDGVVRWWVDGVLQGSYTNMQTPNDGGFSEFKLSPTWGGMGETKTETDYYWYDQIHLSRR